MNEIRKVAYHTLGCKVNKYETSAIEQLFLAAAFQTVKFTEAADVYVINTCSVTNTGEKKSRQIIRRAVTNNPQALVVVTGCYAQLSAEEIMQIDGVDIVIGTQSRQNIVQIVEQALIDKKQQQKKAINYVTDIEQQTQFEELGITLFADRTRATLKIQEGCREFCSYCIIPYARGGLRSRPMTEIIRHASAILKKGYRELVLTGIHLGAYGAEHGQHDLVDVLQELLKIDGLDRIRISSLEASEVNERLITLIQNNQQLCKHLHLPLQAAHDHTLQQMNRKYTVAKYLENIAKIKQAIPEILITTDLIVGFPGETEQQFMDTEAVFKEADFADVHVFSYSIRTGTPAATMPGQVSEAEKRRRSKLAIEWAEEIRLNHYRNSVGKQYSVLLEAVHKTNKTIVSGYTDNYMRVHLELTEPLAIDMLGQIVNVVVTGYDSNGLQASLLV